MKNTVRTTHINTDVCPGCSMKSSQRKGERKDFCKRTRRDCCERRPFTVTDNFSAAFCEEHILVGGQP